MDFRDIKADKEAYSRELLKTDKCDWCQKKKATITDGTYVYCSQSCKKSFIENVMKAIEDSQCDNPFTQLGD